MNLLEIKKLIEENPVSFSTVMAEGKPNAVGVACVKVVSDTEVIITDNYMNQTPKDIQNNKNVCLLVWDIEMKGYKLIGQAEYISSGKWLDFVKKLPENKGLPAKGVILVKVANIIPSA
jgi:predicted pyridoxine 5'-phosphate oxidase superfamily flavin-nucleotide-binding protein